jgi:hypothetical protein
MRACTTRAECSGDVCINGNCAPFDAGQDAPAIEANDAGMETDAGRVDVLQDTIVADIRVVLMDGGAPDVPPIDAPVGPCGAVECSMWVLEDRAAAWSASAAPGSAAAPDSPIRAAFDIESLGIAYVLTDSTYHVLRLSDRTYVEAGIRTAEFPELTSELLAASSVPAGHAGSDPTRESVTFMTRAGAVIYSFNISSSTFSHSRTVTDLGPEWEARLAPTLGMVRAGWLALEDDDRWTSGSPSASCGRAGSRFTVYLAFITSAGHIFDAGTCAAFVQRASYVAFPPFTRGGAPSSDSVAAAFYNDGDLWLLASGE